MSNMTNTGDIFAAFIEADKAIKELPAVREELADTKAHLDATADKLHHVQTKAEFLASTIDTLRAELAQKEAELASATFRESQLKFVVDTIRGALPEPVVPAVAESDQPLTTEPKEDITNVSMDPTDTHTAQPDASPYANTTTAEKSSVAGNLASESAVNTEGQRDSDPTLTTNQTTTQYHSENATSTHGMNTNTPIDANPTEVANTATPSSLPTANGPTESSTPVPAGSPVGQDSPTTSQHDTDGLAYQHQNAPAPAHKPYHGWSYWERPDHITVERFAELGGIVPSWMLPSRHNVG